MTLHMLESIFVMRDLAGSMVPPREPSDDDDDEDEEEDETDEDREPAVIREPDEDE
jgi:hypothetical protein